MGSTVTACLKNGFALPVHAAVVGVNGGLFVLRYTASDQGVLQMELLAEHDEPGAMIVPPLNVMISDARGEAVRVLIGPDGKPQVRH